MPKSPLKPGFKVSSPQVPSSVGSATGRRTYSMPLRGGCAPWETKISFSNAIFISISHPAFLWIGYVLIVILEGLSRSFFMSVHKLILDILRSVVYLWRYGHLNDNIRVKLWVYVQIQEFTTCHIWNLIICHVVIKKISLNIGDIIGEIAWLEIDHIYLKKKLIIKDVA